MIDNIVNITLIILVVSILGAMYRVVKGPSLPDRIIALDSVGVNLIGVIAVTSIKLRTLAFVDAILVIGILGFIGTVAYSKFLVKGVIIDRDTD